MGHAKISPLKAKDKLMYRVNANLHTHVHMHALMTTNLDRLYRYLEATRTYFGPLLLSNNPIRLPVLNVVESKKQFFSSSRL